MSSSTNIQQLSSVVSEATLDAPRNTTHADITPDTIYELGRNITTFIYTLDGNLIAEFDEFGMETTHNLLLDALGEKQLRRWINDAISQGALSGDNLHEHWDTWDSEDQQEFFAWARENMGLFGRVGSMDQSDYPVMSFWNEDPEMYDLLDPCIKALKYDNYISEEPIELHTPLDEPDIYDRIQTPFETDVDTKIAADTDKLERYRLQKELHLLRGDDKKRALKKLGLWYDEPAKHPMGGELEKAGLLGPGQKWWAQQSDDIQRLADSISEDL